MQTISKYNEQTNFEIEFRESRIKKVTKIIEKLKPGKFLDIGCANGDWAFYWQQKGWKSSGIDIHFDYVNLAIQKGIDAKVCDLNKDKIPFADACFDLIFAGEVIEHLIDTDGFIKEIYRCLKPNCHVILTTPNLTSFENRLRILFGIYPIWVNYNLNGSGHIRAYTPRVLKKQLRQHGFKVIKHLGNWVPFLPQRLIDDVRFPYLSFTGSLFPRLSMDIIILATKLDKNENQQNQTKLVLSSKLS